MSEELTLIRSKSEEGNAIINRYTLVAAGVGVLPSPLINSAGIAAMELVMIDDLARNYEFPFPTKLAALKILVSVVGSIGPVYFALKSKSAVSAIPIVGHLIASSIYSLTGAISVFAVGKLFQRHFESGGTLLSKDNSYLKKAFKHELDKGSKEVPKLIAQHTTSR
jgi:uncharacterized protein (DUF697 family)